VATLLSPACGPSGGDQESGNAPLSSAEPAGCPGIAGTTVSWIVPYTPGGGYDVVSRLLEPFLERAIGAEIVVRNRPGAGGLIGAREIHAAEPDGRTLGILNATGLLVQQLEEDVRVPDPVDDFTVLGRLVRSDPVWVVSADSRFRTVDDLFSTNEPLLFGLADVSSVGFLTSSVASELLGMDVQYLAGYAGSRETTLGLLRGEVDLVGFTLESILDRIEAGDLRVVLRLQELPPFDHPVLDGVPFLAGPEGLAARRSLELGRDPEEAVARVQSLVHLLGAGRIAAAPSGLDPALAECLRSGVAQVVDDPDFLASMARAQRGIAYLDAAEVVAEVEATKEARRDLSSRMRSQIDLVRSGR
jgi:tripartite-type tricarboxylate transporter receptor subunit TctC